MDAIVDEVNVRNINRVVMTCQSEDIKRKRAAFFQFINGDVFYDLKHWPKEMELIFWK